MFQSANLCIETLVLVAVWEPPFIFQGCFKITELVSQNNVFFFFRCQSSHADQMRILHDEFSPSDYELTHLYTETDLIPLDMLNNKQEHALYVLIYALHVTLKEMITSRKQHFSSIDPVAMQKMIDKIRPILNRESSIPENEEHTGFSVSMDFYPKEKQGLLAAETLLKQFMKPLQKGSNNIQ